MEEQTKKKRNPGYYTRWILAVLFVVIGIIARYYFGGKQASQQKAPVTTTTALQTPKLDTGIQTNTQNTNTGSGTQDNQQIHTKVYVKENKGKVEYNENKYENTIPPDRHVSDTDIKSIEKNLPKEFSIKILTVTQPECETYANELGAALSKRAHNVSIIVAANLASPRHQKNARFTIAFEVPEELSLYILPLEVR
jgi:hypothetical protein